MNNIIRLQEVVSRLKLRYGYSAQASNVFNDEIGIVAGPESEPLFGLIETILSQQSLIATTQRMSVALRTAFPEWQQALAAGSEGIQRVLAQARGNLTQVKATYIHSVLHRLDAEQGELSLQFLRTWSDTAARDYLLSFSGVGPKTASCVLLFNLQRPVQPVDTHIHRIAQRLKFVHEDAKPVDTAAWFDAHLPTHWETHYEFHLNAIDHGRLTCRAQNPQCATCVLNDLCPSARLAPG